MGSLTLTSIMLTKWCEWLNQGTVHCIPALSISFSFFLVHWRLLNSASALFVILSALFNLVYIIFYFYFFCLYLSFYLAGTALSGQHKNFFYFFDFIFFFFVEFERFWMIYSFVYLTSSLVLLFLIFFSLLLAILCYVEFKRHKKQFFINLKSLVWMLHRHYFHCGLHGIICVYYKSKKIYFFLYTYTYLDRTYKNI